MFNFCIKSINFVEFLSITPSFKLIQIHLRNSSPRINWRFFGFCPNEGWGEGPANDLNFKLPQLKTSRLGFKLPSPLSQNSSNTPSPSNLRKKLSPKFNLTQSIWDSLIFRANTCLTAIIAVRQVLHCSAMHDDSDFKGSSGGLTIHNANCIEELKGGRK